MYGTITQERLNLAIVICQSFFHANGLTFSLESLRSSSRFSEVVANRAVVVKLLHGKFKANELSGMLDRDHSTILHLLRGYDLAKHGGQREKVQALNLKATRFQIQFEISIHQQRIKELKEKLKSIK